MDYEPLLKGIARLIGATGRVGVDASGKATDAVTPHSSVDVERWLGNLSTPEKQIPVVHDYLRGQQALEEARQTGATHVRNISVPIWTNAQAALQQKVDQDPELQKALKTMYVGMKTPRDVQTTVVKPTPEEAKPAVAQATVVPPTTPAMPAKPARVLPQSSAITKQQANAWNEFAIATESQDGNRADAALEQIKALHDSDETPPGQTPKWKKALDYMAGLENHIQQMQQAQTTGDQWGTAIDQYKKQSGFDSAVMPKHIRDTVERMEDWADAQKPPSMIDTFSEALGVPRAVMSSGDLSAPGRQGILMMGRGEYWQAFKPMFESWDESKFLEHQNALRNHPDIQTALEAGLTITDLHNKLAPREEAYASKMAERIPFLGPMLVKPSEQAYNTFLNQVRLNTFSNVLKMHKAAGFDASNEHYLKSLADWINTSTGRGKIPGFNPGPLSTVLFSPRLAISRFQTFNPLYYANMHPLVRAEALKSNLAAAAAIVTLVSLAGAAGAKVTWDFRNPDAGKIRIGNLRYDLGGGHFQFLRLMVQLATNQKVNSETGKVVELGAKFGAPSRLDVMTQFLISKEAPVASLVTDWARGKDMSGKKFNLPDEVISRTVPLAMQDMYDVLKDKGVEGLILSVPTIFGVGVQDYASKPEKEVITHLGVHGQIPADKAAEYARQIEQADSLAATMAAERSRGKNAFATKAILRNYVRVMRDRVKADWIKANRDVFMQARQNGVMDTTLVAPGGAQ